MANDKREQAMEYEMNEFSRRIEMPLGEGQKQAFRAGWSNRGYYAAATAEGIPQSDGWVAIETVDDLPKEDGVYLFTCNFSDTLSVRQIQLLTMSDGSRRVAPGTNLLLGDEVIAWRPLPAPYQRKSEGDSK